MLPFCRWTMVYAVAGLQHPFCWAWPHPVVDMEMCHPVPFRGGLLSSCRECGEQTLSASARSASAAEPPLLGNHAVFQVMPLPNDYAQWVGRGVGDRKLSHASALSDSSDGRCSRRVPPPHPCTPRLIEALSGLFCALSSPSAPSCFFILLVIGFDPW